MLHFPLIHPEILGALAAAGHGSTVLVADANYAHSTGTRTGCPVVHLNLAPGLVTVEQVLLALVGAAPFEAAALLRPDDGSPSPVRERYTRLLGADVPVSELPRAQFRAACRGEDLALTVATGDTAFYANALLTVGAVAPAAAAEPGRLDGVAAGPHQRS